MKESSWLFHPIPVFVFSVVALGASLFLYIYWYVEVSAGIEGMVKKYQLDPDQVLESQTWVVILVLSVLVGIILMGIFTIFVYHQKTLQLYKMQHNFINNFTHELKTPVTSLKLYLETFLRHELPREKQLKYIGYMLQDVTRLSENTMRILDLAKIESKSYGGTVERWDLVHALEQFLENNKHLFKGCVIDIHNPDHQSYPCRINVPLMQMLVMNLLVNAVQYNESPIPRVDISLEKRNRRIWARFRDNGIGLEKTEMKKIFKKFYQVGRAEDRSARGSGIGLYLAQSIARMHGGKVQAESGGAGRGSVFTLILPQAGKAAR